ncbi:LysR substrate-binding domain-containing protein [Mesobacterium sp. TK19101]|uniref:LysR substrate-binding domain-containing protein n=1 Tax=Mesobacterium hydrothermale TaxID=3111907 RepID=A0ABU6HGW1_9RHOB|nr:LysR substrate-binding domain-containing protein [Mesobacterium sp. TK19101]MEC3861693.1 LysR substrate-binding domain-containing protein [Mesobacterium sp. TK19101]
MSTPFRQFQAFHATLQRGTVTAAAEYLGISQPAISNLLAQLERRTKLKLFERTRGRLVPTPEAMVLFDEIDTVVRGLDHVNQAVTDLQNQKAGQLQVACNHALAFGFLPNEIARFAKGRPNLTIAFQSQYSGKVQEWVTAGLFEIGLCEMPVRQEAMEQRHFRFETLCALPEGSGVADKPVLTPSDLDSYPFIVMGNDHMVSRRTREAFLSDGAHFRIRCHTDLFRNALNLVKQGLGAAMIDPFTLSADDGAGYVVRRFDPAVLLDIVVVTAKDKPLSAIGREFLDQVLPRMQAVAVG